MQWGEGYKIETLICFLLLVWSVNCICIYLKYIPSCTKWCHRNFLRQNQTIISNHISFEWASSEQLKKDFTPMFRGRSVGLILSSVPGWSWPKNMRFTKVTLFHLSVKGCLLYFRLVVLQGKDWKLASPRNNERRLKVGAATLRLGIMNNNKNMFV